MTIGEQIIAAIANGPLIRITNAERNDWGSQAVFVWSQSAAEQLEAVVEAHIEERVRVRLELDRQAEREIIDAVISGWESFKDPEDFEPVMQRLIEKSKSSHPPRP